MREPEEIVQARKLVEKGFKYYRKGDLDKACPILTKALSIYLKYVDEDGDSFTLRRRLDFYALYLTAALLELRKVNAFRSGLRLDILDLTSLR
ncbi:MAG: hypothetical protein OdinLCB4_006760 [Candidatus Odinarchaeum yellowstonii]|uniref:Tetratricopeptide repeat protein n=1 Tax=Odinarchaeota yellowstonii (strain LCB_4) TaxID=1841599 RepID=A0AAF0IBA2_ODILC|nr:MAG: hypothetical protein OdinLCB4_006760 [Candidatus Odinarchaeum yellowstonii]